MHPLHDYIAKQVAQKLKDRKVVVWYDPRSEFKAFVAEVRGPTKPAAAETRSTTVGGIDMQLAEYDGSYLQLRNIVEPHTRGDVPDCVLIYLPGCERDPRGSVLMELEKAGQSYEPQLRGMVRHVLGVRYTQEVIDELLAPERLSYEDMARIASDPSNGDTPSILKTIFHGVHGRDGALVAWLASNARDEDIEEKEGGRELARLLHSRLGLEVPEEAGLARLRSISCRYVLAGEFRIDFAGTPPASVDAIPKPHTRDEEAAVRDVAKRLRTDFPDAYPGIADRVEADLHLQDARIEPQSLGSVDTFRFEEHVLLTHCCELIAAQRFDAALVIVNEREGSFWLDRDVSRRAQWEATRLMAELGRTAIAVRAAVGRAGDDSKRWLDSYTASDGWYRMDQAQRRLEAWVAHLDDDPDERSLGVVRRAYEDTCHAMALGFTRVLAKAGWLVPGAMQQSRVYSAIVAEQPKPVAYIFVDAMRFEMGVELTERLPSDAEVSIRPVVGSLPSITPIGMAALLPGASGSFSVVEQGGKLGARIEGTFLPDLGARKKFAASRLPTLVDVTLDELLSLTASKLAKRLEGAEVIIVRSQEIDNAGENGFPFQARQVMDTVIDNLARAIRKLAAAGVANSVVSADHGHLFFAWDRDESMRTDRPGGDEVELHRRCWIGRGGSTPAGCIRVSAAALGYDSDLELVFPAGAGVFKAGGDLAFHHGGPSLQEIVVPVLTVRLSSATTARATVGPVTVAGLPDAVTNRIFSITLQLGGKNLALFPDPMVVRPLLVAGGRQVGAVGMAIDAQLDRASGSVTLKPGTAVTVAFLLNDESVASLRVVVQDPSTDAELYRSPTDIPVHLGI
jgi:hypothetical protein